MAQKKLLAIALDDEPAALQLIRRYCAQVEFINLENEFTVPSDALKYLKKYPVDLLFLDIEMPDILGTEFIKKIEQSVMVIFTTAHSNYAVDAFNLNVVDFLLKPYSVARFRQAADKALNSSNNSAQSSGSNEQFIFLRADYSLVKITLTDILYIEGLEDYCKIHIASGCPLVFRITMKALLEKLPESQFLRVHRSYIIRIDKCERMRGNSIYINGIEINIGRIYKQNVADVFDKRFL